MEKEEKALVGRVHKVTCLFISGFIHVPQKTAQIEQVQKHDEIPLLKPIVSDDSEQQLSAAGFLVS